MADELDLESGDPREADGNSRRRRREREQREGGGGTRREPNVESEVRHQLTRAFDGLAKSREAREDVELAEAIREEGDAMTEGFVQLTSNVPFLRMPLVIFLNLLITLLAFGRVGGILLGRWYSRRERRAQEKAVEAGEVEYEYDANGVPYAVTQ